MNLLIMSQRAVNGGHITADCGTLFFKPILTLKILSYCLSEYEARYIYYISIKLMNKISIHWYNKNAVNYKILNNLCTLRIKKCGIYFKF